MSVSRSSSPHIGLCNTPSSLTAIPLKQAQTRGTTRPHHPLVDNHQDRLNGALRHEINTLSNRFGTLEQKLANLQSLSHQAEVTKSAILSNLSHEFRTPLNAIIGFTELLQSGAAGNLDQEKAAEYLSDIRHSGEHLLELIETLLDTANLQKGRETLSLKKVRLDDLVHEAVRDIAPVAYGQNVDIRLENTAPEARLFVDPRRIKQALRQILILAVRRTAEDEELSIKIDTTPGFVTLSFSEFVQHSHVMDAYTAPCGVNHPDLGVPEIGELGFGLSVAQTIADLHDGSLNIVSTEERAMLTLILPSVA